MRNPSGPMNFWPMFRFIVRVFGVLAAFAAVDSGGAAQDTPQVPQNKPIEEVNLTYSAWTKSCTRAADIDGKQICFSIKFGRPASGQPIVVAVVVEREGESRKTLRVLLPLGVQTVHGTRIIVDSGKPVLSPYVFCVAEGCVSDYEATPDLVNNLQKGRKLTVQAINSNGAPLWLPLPLADFDSAFRGRATDWDFLDDQQKKILLALFRIKNAAGLATSSPKLSYPSSWTKFCLKGQDANARQVCFTGADGRAESGQPLIAAVIIEPEGESKKLLRVTLPLGMNLTNGTRVIIDSNSSAQSPYVICFANGCMSDYELTPALLASLRNGRSVAVLAIENTGRAISLALPLDGFNRAYDGPPIDPKAYAAEQKRLQEELARRASASRERPPNNPPENASASNVLEHAGPVASPSGAVEVPFGRRVALVIGNSAYQHVPMLPNPRRDAIIVADALRQANFNVVTLQNDLGREQLVSALRDFARQAEGAGWAVVYYAGHGMEVAGVNYLIPVDAKISTDRDISLEAVSIDQVLNAAERAKQLRIVLLDACRDNPFANQMKRTLTIASRSVSRGLAQMEPDPGTLVVFAAKHGETALDGDTANSPFALAFVRNIRTPGVEVRRLFDYVRDDVMDMTGRRQQPYSYGSVPGRQDFYFTAAK